MNIQKYTLLLVFMILNVSLAVAGSIRGVVRDEQGNPLSGVNIVVQDKNIAVASNQFGQYALDKLPGGKYTLTFSYVGYQSLEFTVELKSEQTAVENSVMIEEILTGEAVIVTAQKRLEQIQDVPIAISVIDDALIRQNAQVNLEVLSAYVPGIIVNAYSSNRPNYVIRGLTSDAFLASAQPRVSVFYNNIPISRNTGALIELYDMEKIEILTGPQGTLFGRGAQIGSIHLISKKPVSNFEGNFSVGAGNLNQQIFTGMINLPISENFYARLAGRYTKRDGFINNTSGGRLNEQKTTAFRSSFRDIHRGNTMIDLMFDFQEDLPGGTAFMSRTYPNRLGQIDVFAQTASFERGTELGLNRKIINLNFNVHHFFNPNLDLNSFISYREHRADEIWDGDGSAAPALDFAEEVDVKQITFESRLNFDLGYRFKGFAGVSYWREKVNQTVRFSPNEQSLFFLFFDPQSLVDDHGNPNLMPATPPLPKFGQLGGLPLPADHVEASFQHATSEALESFVDGTYRITKNFSLTAGLRFIIDRLSLEAQNKFVEGQPSILGLLTGNAPNVLFATGDVADKGQMFESLVGRFVAGYVINENFKTYAGYARGRRPNVIQLRADARTELLDDEKVNSYELGFKGNLSDRFFLDLASYYYTYNDFQTRAWVADQVSGEFQLIVKDGGKAHTYGFESNLKYVLNSYIQLYGNYTYIHARFDKTDSHGNQQEYAGNTFRLTPEHTWSVRAHLSYNLIKDFDLFIIPSYLYRSHHFFEDDNTPGLEQEGYGLFNLQSGVYYLPLHLELSFFAYNLLNKNFLVSGGNTGNLFGIPTFVPGSPLTYGIKLQWDF